MTNIQVIFLSAVLFNSFRYSTNFPLQESNPFGSCRDENCRLFGGDMILNAQQYGVLTGSISGRNGLIAEFYRWPNNIVLYEIDPKFDETQRSVIRKAMDGIETMSCLRFKERSESSSEYVQIIQQTKGCFSEVGYQQSVQLVNLAPNCVQLGTVTHEMLHVLGFFHEHQAANRDDFVVVHEENIDPDYIYAFNKYADTYVTDFGIPYDYTSIMHYVSTAFSKNGEKTIEAKDPEMKIGTTGKLTALDVLKINKMYNCTEW